MPRYSSIVHSNSKALIAIQQLYLNGSCIHLDPMFNIGGMYKGNASALLPLLRYDIKPLLPGVLHGDARSLQVRSGSIKSMILDPPWLLNASGKSSHFSDRFSCLRNRDELNTLLLQLIVEAYRVLVTDGILIFKCQDFIHNRRKVFMSFMVLQHAFECGFNPLDHFVLIPGSRKRSQKAHMLQAASQSDHSHLYVFRKRKSRKLCTSTCKDV